MNRPVFFAPSRVVGSRRLLLLALVAFAAALACLAGCAGQPGGCRPVLIENRGANAISLWNEIAVAIAASPPAPTGATLSERTPGPDVVTVQLAVYDAVIATAGTHQPYAVRPTTDPKGASRSGRRWRPACWRGVPATVATWPCRPTCRARRPVGSAV